MTVALRHPLAALGAGNASALFFVIGRRAVTQGASSELTIQLLVSRVLPLGVLAGSVILVVALSLLDTVGRRIRPAAAALAAPGYAIPAVAVIRTATGSVIPPPTPTEVVIAGVASASAMYVIAWFAEGPGRS